jgi:hypothetical protein
VPRGTPDSGSSILSLRVRGSYPLRLGLSGPIPLAFRSTFCRSSTPDSPEGSSGLGSSAFARHYLQNHVCFLFLRVLRCFSSPRIPRPYLFDSVRARSGIYPERVPPFGYPRINGYLRLPAAFRSLSRPSSASGA